MNTTPLEPVSLPLEAPAAAPAPAIIVTEPKGNSWHITFSVGVIMVILVVGALYFWGERIAKEEGISPERSGVELAP